MKQKGELELIQISSDRTTAVISQGDAVSLHEIRKFYFQSGIIPTQIEKAYHKLRVDHPELPQIAKNDNPSIPLEYLKSFLCYINDPLETGAKVVIRDSGLAWEVVFETAIRSATLRLIRCSQ